jgi:hypothetical protein
MGIFFIFYHEVHFQARVNTLNVLVNLILCVCVCVRVCVSLSLIHTHTYIHCVSGETVNNLEVGSMDYSEQISRGDTAV